MPFLSRTSTEILGCFWVVGLSPWAWGCLSNLQRAQHVELCGVMGKGESNWGVRQEGVGLGEPWV